MAENVMTTALLVAVFLAVCQFAYAVHVRSSLTMAAAEGARYGARVGSTPGQAAARTKDLIASSVGPRYARSVSAGRGAAHGTPVVRVDVTADVPVLGPYGVGLTLRTSARAVLEDRTS